MFLRFREEPIAVVGDIHSRFHQVFVSEEDRDALQFLWYQDGDLDKPLVTYRRRCIHLGGIYSPSVASFALRRIAEDNETNACEKAIHTIYKNFYLDDLGKSFSTVEEAFDMIKQLCSLLKSEGFHLIKFIFNSKSFLEIIPNENLASNVLNFANRELPIQKALVIYWDAETDRRQVKVRIRLQLHTRRGLLSMMGQTYDPLGLLQPFLLPARRVLQQA